MQEAFMSSTITLALPAVGTWARALRGGPSPPPAKQTKERPVPMTPKPSREMGCISGDRGNTLSEQLLLTILLFRNHDSLLFRYDLHAHTFF